MSAYAMSTGKLHGEPVTRPTRNGGRVTFFKIRVINGAEIEWWDVATFSDTAREELEGVNEGDAVSAVGVLHVEMFEYRGEQRIKRSLTADRVMALKPQPKKAKPQAEKPPRASSASAPEQGPGRSIQSKSWVSQEPIAVGNVPFDDAIPFFPERR
jgi:single-stranded DNA-binding protein